MRKFLLLVVLASLPALAKSPVRAHHAMVVAREGHATDAGAAVLASGGNAIDAAVAVGFALAVTHPSAGNLGGGGFMLVRMADGRATFIDFRERAPLAASRDMYSAPGVAANASSLGYLAAGIPGTVKGLAFAHARFGSKPWKDLLEPACQLARNGFPVSYGFSQQLRGSSKLPKFEESKRIFLNGGKFFEQGDTLMQPELAATLERIRDKGAQDFYEGETARILVEDMKAHGGILSAADLANYKVIEREPLTGTYHGHTIISAPPPSSGGIGLLQMLGMLDGTGYEKSGAGSAYELHFLAETMRRFFADRAEYLGDPDFAPQPVARLLAPTYIATRRSTIDPDHATPSSAIKAGLGVSHESSQTTHFSIVDAQGNAVSMTYTLNDSYGSGAVAEHLGFLLNNEMDDFSAHPGKPNDYGLLQGEANAIAANKTPLSSMTPTIILKDGKLKAVLGTPGGPTIINSVLQVTLNLIDFHMNAQDAVDQPRIHHQWMPDTLFTESNISPDTVALLEQRGHHVKTIGKIGEMAVILWDGEWLQGAADSRTEGAARGF